MKKTAYQARGGLALVKYGQVLNLSLLLFVLMAFWSSLSFGEVTIRWFGHSCFLIESSQGTKLLTDPLGEETGFPLPEVMPDIITISHEHFDHNYVQMAKGNPKVLRGLKDGGKDWAHVQEQVGKVTITTVPTYHDGSKGS
ncbi:MAG: MBL fold metallo-hydrolase, partial [Candidatus Brocadiales bacterium]